MITEVAPMLLKLTQLYDVLDVKKRELFLSRKCVVEGLHLLLVSIVLWTVDFSG